MGHLESFLDFQYRTIAVLNEKEQTLLVRDQLTGRVLVRRSFPLETAGVYEELKNIRHRNLVQVLEVYRLEDTCVVLEEYVNGCSVAELLIREKRLGVQEAGKLILAVCRGLFVLHKKNMVCRSVRPDTIRISQDGIVKLMDFSAVREFDRDKPRDTVLIGTEDYAAPEQYGFGQSDERTDIYAVGVLLNVLLTGEHPKKRIYWGERVLRRVIRICIQVDPEKRFKNIELLMQMLEETLGLTEKGISEKEDCPGRGRPGAARRFYGGLPGLRSDAWYRKVLALAGYFFLIFLTYSIIVIEGETAETPGEWVRMVFEVLQLLVPAAFVFNAWNCSRLSVLPKMLRPHFRLIMAGIIWVVLDVIKSLCT